MKRIYWLLLLLSLPIVSFSQPRFSVQFTGSNRLEAQIALPTDNLTVSLWLKPTALSNNAFPIIFSNTQGNRFGIVLRTDLVQGSARGSILLGNNDLITGNTTRLPLMEWTHLTITHQDSVWRLYRNGMLIGRGKSLSTISSTLITFGKDYVGEISDVRLWSYTMSACEVIKNMNTNPTQAEGTLLLHYPMLNATSDTLYNTSSKFHGQFNAYSTAASTITYSNTVLPVNIDQLPTYAISSFPTHLQFFSRDSQNTSIHQFRGLIKRIPGDSLIYEKFSNDMLVKRISIGQSSDTSFFIEDTLESGLFQYTLRLLYSSDAKRALLAEAADITVGDVYVIDGQSNAHPTNDGYFWNNPYARSFGIQTAGENLEPYDPADTLWGLATASGFGAKFSGPYLVGAWGLGLMERLIERYSVPICIINGAAGGTTIDRHLRNPNFKLDLNTVYGRLCYRLVKSGLKNHVRSLFWYQGEYNHSEHYYSNFKQLYETWQEDLSSDLWNKSPHQVYLFQIRPCCVAGDSKLREVQRTLPDSFPKMEVIATAGLPGYDGCHYQWFGYVDIAEKVSKIVGRDYYNDLDTVDISSPNIIRAAFSDSTNTTIELTFTNHTPLSIIGDTIYGGQKRFIENYFYVNGHDKRITSVLLDSNKIYLNLAPGSTPTTITYLPDQTYEDNDTLIYEGPFILNGRAVPLLTFADVPIQPFYNDTPLDTPLHVYSTQPFGIYSSSSLLTAKTHIYVKTPTPEPITVSLYNYLGCFLGAIPYPAVTTSAVISLPEQWEVFPNGTYYCNVTVGEHSRIIKLLRCKVKG